MLRALGLPEAAPIRERPAPTRLMAGSKTSEFFRMLARAAASPPRPLSIGNGEGEGTAPRRAALTPPPSPLEREQGGEAAPPAIRQMVTTAADQEKIPPALLAAVVEVESHFQPRAVSKAGAIGLTQLMPGTARALGVADPFDPRQNLAGGARFLHGLIEHYSGNVSLALAAYNAGPQAVDDAGGQIPPFAETQAYVQLVLRAYQRNVHHDSAGGTS